MQLIENLDLSKHFKMINDLIYKYDNILLLSGWINVEGAKLISESLTHAMERGAIINVVSNEEHTDKKSIKLFRELNIEHSIINSSSKYFHTKLYYFDGNGEYTYIIGSPNITKGGLDLNEELSVCISGLINDINHKKIQPYIEHIRNTYFPQKNSHRRNTYFPKKMSHRRNTMAPDYLSFKLA